MFERKWLVIAGEEAGPKSNKMGGIWNVIDAEATTLAALMSSGAIRDEVLPGIIVAGPYYGHAGTDWHKSLNRITDMTGLEPYDVDDEVTEAITAMGSKGMEIISGVRHYKGIPIIYLMFNTSDFSRIMSDYKGTGMRLCDKVKTEAFSLIGLDSLKYESMGNGQEYTHYLNLSYAISEFVLELVTSKAKRSKDFTDKAISEFASSLMPSMHVYLHCHEFGVFYTLARLEKLGISVNSMATYHATIPGRTSGHKSLQKILDNDGSWDPKVPENMARLEALSSYADVVTAVGDSTRKEVKLFYGIDSIVVRNGIDDNGVDISLEKKKNCREKIQSFLSDTIQNVYGGVPIPAKKILPIFSISRIEIENKGYPDLLDSLMLLDRMVNMQIVSGRQDEDMRVVCFIIAAHGPKSNVPAGFPLNLPDDVLMGEELRLQRMIKERMLEPAQLITGRRRVTAVLYPQWISSRDGGLNMSADELMAGCIAGIFPSRYEPFLLTGLEAGKEATPSIVSKVCGFSDALASIKRLVMGMGGVIVVDNIDLPYNETITDYALAMDYFLDTYVDDKVKYSLLCQEANLLAKEMNWLDPVKEYYELLTGACIVQEEEES
ncbi:glycogen synthase [Methanomethylovorans sp.]|uniref:glycogen synthase n=1 Tax=Methanomethylovorans sp. TaxID=2758717 RepID=UPI000AD50DE7|nr:glycogen synthase [Methanomethylovorans sp.]